MMNSSYRELLNMIQSENFKKLDRLYCNEKTINELSDNIVNVYQTFGHPTALIYDLMAYLLIICDRFYGCTLKIQACKKS